MDTKYTEIECLKLEIEKRMGKPLKSPTDFNQLSLRLQKELKEEIKHLYNKANMGIRRGKAQHTIHHLINTQPLYRIHRLV